MAVDVTTSKDANKEIDALDAPLQAEVRARVDKVRAGFPNVAGLLPMRAKLKNHYKMVVRGDWRMVFKSEGGGLTLVAVRHRSKMGEFYESGGRDVRAGSSWVVVPAKFVREAMRGKPSRNFASEYIMWSLGRNLRAARLAARLDQKTLARRIGKAQSTVSMAEKGTIRVSPAYVRAVLKACRVPRDWGRKYWDR